MRDSRRERRCNLLRGGLLTVVCVCVCDTVSMFSMFLLSFGSVASSIIMGE